MLLSSKISLSKITNFSAQIHSQLCSKKVVRISPARIQNNTKVFPIIKMKGTDDFRWMVAPPIHILINAMTRKMGFMEIR